MPFARDDRRRTVGCTNGLDLALSIIKDYNLDITIADPHSYVTEVLPYIPQSGVVKAFRNYTSLFSDYDGNGPPIVLVPDDGARKKADSWALYCESWEPVVDVIQAGKTRDPNTGKLSGFWIDDKNLPANAHKRPLVIIDDICDGGGTFLGLAEEAKRQGFKDDIRLGVTHGLFTKGTKILTDVFSKVVTCGPPQDGVETVSWKNLYAEGVV
jgi:ribose-phosphate pyrophosphokinase